MSGTATVALADLNYADCPNQLSVIEPVPSTSMLLTYPAAARKARMTGEVRLSGEISAEGCVSSVTVLAGVNPLLDAAVLQGLVAQSFSPALCGSRSIVTRFTAIARFSLSLKYPHIQ